ncbi:hypothetical protein BGZ60DRAFT_515618 [Tricladium varicosporioides]|nr:hypothetical protein BGZ60DRAFT_515618 [Hymenoscyphus varicosporioides]
MNRTIIDLDNSSSSEGEKDIPAQVRLRAHPAKGKEHNKKMWANSSRAKKPEFEDYEDELGPEDSRSVVHQQASSKTEKARSKNMTKYNRRKSSKKQKRHQAMVEDALSDEAEAALEERQLETPDPQSLLKLLDTTLQFVASADVKKWLEAISADDESTISEIEEKCATLAKILRAERSPTKSSPSRRGNGVLEGFEGMYVYRDLANTIMMLAPMEFFKASTSMKGKTFGFVRPAGSYFPLIYSISGWQNIIATSSTMLDSDFWTKEVFRVGDFFCHKFRTTGWEDRRGKPRGMDFASHVEPKLMLFFACHIVCQMEGRVMSVRKQIAAMHKIGRLPNPPAAEIILNRKPCKCCRQFRDALLDHTGINFTFIQCPTLGKVYLERDQYGNPLFSLTADNEVDAEDSDSSDGDPAPNHVALAKRNYPQLGMPPPRQITREETEQRVNLETERTRIEKYRYTSSLTTLKDPLQGPKKRPGGKQKSNTFVRNTTTETFHEDDNVSVYDPPSNRSRAETPETPTKKVTRSVSAGLGTALVAGHSYQELAQIERSINSKKRKDREQERVAETTRGSYPSPPSTKKRTHTKY